MRQRITVENLKELSPEQQEKLKYLWKPKIGDCIAQPNVTGKFVVADEFLLKGLIKENCLPLLSIGQMMEIISEMHDIELTIEQPKRMYWVVKISTRVSSLISWYDNKGEEIFHKRFTDEEDELCNCLFQAVKEIL